MARELLWEDTKSNNLDDFVVISQTYAQIQVYLARAIFHTDYLLAWLTYSPHRTPQQVFHLRNGASLSTTHSYKRQSSPIRSSQTSRCRELSTHTTLPHFLL